MASLKSIYLTELKRRYDIQFLIKFQIKIYMEETYFSFSYDILNVDLAVWFKSCMYDFYFLSLQLFI